MSCIDSLKVTKSPGNQDLNEALANLEERYPQGRDKEKVIQQYYDEWSKTYDRDMELLNYSVPAALCKTAISFLGRNTAGRKTLDIGSGTGIIGRELVKVGYAGELHALDYSQAMLDKLDRNIYSYAVRHEMAPSTHIPIADHTYDVITIVGTFGPSTMSPKCTEDIVRVTKSGGFVLIAMRDTDQATIQRVWQELDEEFGRLEKEGKWKKIKTEKCDHYSWKVGNNENGRQEVKSRFLVYEVC